MKVAVDIDAPGLIARKPPSRARAAARYLPLVLWFVAISAVLSSLAISHWLTLPRPDKHDQRLAAGLAAIADERPGWLAVHALYTDCKCSRRVIDHLTATERPRGIREVVLLVGRDSALRTRLTERGMHTIELSPEQLFERYGIESAPMFLLVDPARAVRYVGGYTNRKQGPEIMDLAIMQTFLGGGDAAELPLYGCAVSDRLQQLADPMAIKR